MFEQVMELKHHSDPPVKVPSCTPAEFLLGPDRHVVDREWLVKVLSHPRLEVGNQWIAAGEMA